MQPTIVINLRPRRRIAIMLLFGQGGVMPVCDRVLSVCLSVNLFVCRSVSRITHERVYECRLVVGMSKGWLSKSDYILLLIRIRTSASYDILSLDRGHHRASSRQYSDLAVWACHLVTGVNAAWVSAVTRSAADRTSCTVAKLADPLDSLADEVPPFRRVIAGHLHRVASALQPRVIGNRDVSTAGHYNHQYHREYILKARPSSRGASSPNFMVMAMALASKVQALAWDFRAELTIFDITLKLKVRQLLLK